MAKEQFTRSKPHVNISLLPRLVQRGFTPTGAYQVLHGLVVTDPQDRQLVAQAIAKNEELYFKIELKDCR